MNEFDYIYNIANKDEDFQTFKIIFLPITCKITSNGTLIKDMSK